MNAIVRPPQQAAAPAQELSKFYPRYVEDPYAQEPCWDCDHQPMINQNGTLVKQPPRPRCPFCRGTGMVPRKVLAQNPQHHASIVGYDVTDEGEKVRPKPPTVAEIVAQGYSKEQAIEIATEELEKARLGYEPYGDKIPPAAPAQPAKAAEPPKEDPRIAAMQAQIAALKAQAAASAAPAAFPATDPLVDGGF